MNRMWKLVLTAVVVAGLWASQRDQAEVQLQAAITKETVDGDLEGAIGLYKKIVAAHAGNRAVAAKALVRMGQCYEKLGMAESRKAYERVVRDFSDQNEQASVARGRLSTLGQGPTAAGVRVRQLWTKEGLDLFSSNILQDGRRVVYIDWANQDSLAIADMVTGESRKLSTRTDGDGAYELVVSPDSKLIAYAWYMKKGEELRVMGVDGSAPRSIYSNPELEAEPAAWFPDGKHLVARFYKKDQAVQLAVISIGDGKARVLKSGAWQQQPGNVSVSPDGQYILYDFPPSSEASERDIYLMAADGSSETVLVRHPANDILMGWAPDGKYILFKSNRSGSMSLYAVPMSGNTPAGEPRQVRSNVENIRLLGFGRNGSLYYSESIGTGREVFLAELDPETGKMAGRLRLASPRHLGEKGTAGFSPDGKILVYQSGPTRDGGGARTATGITVRNLDSGNERDIETPMAYIGLVSHNGKEIRVNGRDNKGKTGGFGIDPQTGEFGPREGGTLARGGKQRMLQPQPNFGGVRTVERDVQTGQETVLVSEMSGTFRNQGARSSEDWNWLVWRSIDSDAGEIRLMSRRAGGGEPIVLTTVKRPQDLATFILTPDSKYALFAQGENGNDEIWRVPIAGGQPVPTGIKAKRIQSISVHPDGRQVAIGSFGDSQDSVWVMENWQSELRASR
jgi:WD40 repeat protein